jgi:DNA mismatch endonuclease (patch repair protein)
MADIVSKEKRSANMSAIRSRDTSPEIWLRKQLFSAGYRYRKNVSNIYGHPDLYLAKYKTAIFIHGCFWHRHPGCKFAYIPKSNRIFWMEKFQKNIERDAKVQTTLRSQHIKYLIIWECTVKKMIGNEDYKNNILNKILSFLNNDEPSEEY